MPSNEMITQNEITIFLPPIKNHSSLFSCLLLASSALVGTIILSVLLVYCLYLKSMPISSLQIYVIIINTINDVPY
jgi:hypothetical protein